MFIFQFSNTRQVTRSLYKLILRAPTQIIWHLSIVTSPLYKHARDFNAKTEPVRDFFT